jgi:hypothetical protein
VISKGKLAVKRFTARTIQLGGMGAAIPMK